MSIINQKVIAKNTLMLYLRMGLMALIGLYTSRVVLDALGVVDQGLYDAIGGIVAMLSCVSGTMSAACQRFYLMALGQDDSQRLKHLFSMTIVIFAVFSLVAIGISESLGPWFINNKMKLAGRDEVAGWVFQCSILSFVAVVMRMPYQGMVIAREKMKVFAYISVIEALLALGIAILLRHSSFDRLKEYSLLMMLSQVAVTVIYALYCIRFYSECRFCRYWDRDDFKSMFSYTGWNLIGSSASVFKVHGVTVLLDMFFGPALVAPRTMAFKLYAMVCQLRENFITASKPQIMMSYSAGEREGMKKLVWQTSKFSNYLLLLAAIPLGLEIDYLLGIWLKEVPDYTSLFALILLANAVVEGIDTPVSIAIQANGDMRNYQLTIGVIQLTVLPIAYLMLKTGQYPPQTVFLVSMAVTFVAVLMRFHFAKKLVGLRPLDFLTKVIVPVLAVAALTIGAGLLVRNCFEEGPLRLICVTAACFVVQAAAVFTIGMTAGERTSVLRAVRAKLYRGK